MCADDDHCQRRIERRKHWNCVLYGGGNVDRQQEYRKSRRKSHDAWVDKCLSEREFFARHHGKSVCPLEEVEQHHKYGSVKRAHFSAYRSRKRNSHKSAVGKGRRELLHGAGIFLAFAVNDAAYDNTQRHKYRTDPRENGDWKCRVRVKLAVEGVDHHAGCHGVKQQIGHLSGAGVGDPFRLVHTEADGYHDKERKRLSEYDQKAVKHFFIYLPILLMWINRVNNRKCMIFHDSSGTSDCLFMICHFFHLNDRTLSDLHFGISLRRYRARRIRRFVPPWGCSSSATDKSEIPPARRGQPMSLPDFRQSHW